MLPATSRSQAPTRAYPPLSSFLTISEPRLSIGSEDTEGPELFAWIWDAVLDSALNIYVLDRADHQVRAFSKTGRFLGSAGRRGHGPGDLSEPKSVFHDRRGSLYVVDRVTGVNQFDSRNGRPTYRIRFASDLLPMDACVADGRIFIAAWHDGNILQEYTRQGSFARGLEGGWSSDTNAFMRETVNETASLIQCDPTRLVLYICAFDLGLVRAYDLEGSLLWQAELPDVDRTRFVFLPAATHPTREIHHDNVAALVRVGPDYLVVSVRNTWLSAGGSAPRTRAGMAISVEEREFITYLLSARTGEVLTRQAKSVLLSDVIGNVGVAYEQNPFPRAYLVHVSEVKR